ncbi:hypothetical protein J7I84_01485 [Arthrobacter sp. ISL-85]|uniref:hypothetical protein n=1 Tax=Arthrobacter sp. ISL-85 TaxID=2819115 RepID=UPI001BE94AE1|nr:hypothetical protein [Arthrobacter sp. ISL-85]MBT2565180.1 hypothetical protein [Arthrobacter sp. ISL-85]
MTEFSADSILVLLDAVPGGELSKSAADPLGAARSVGTPVALIVSYGAQLDGFAASAG